MCSFCPVLLQNHFAADFLSDQATNSESLPLVYQTMTYFIKINLCSTFCTGNDDCEELNDEAKKEQSFGYSRIGVAVLSESTTADYDDN
jgi:hypothetical protein